MCKDRISFTAVRIISVLISLFLLFFTPDNDPVILKHVEPTKKALFLIKNKFIELLTDYIKQQRK